jgi:hypothetical protein
MAGMSEEQAGPGGEAVRHLQQAVLELIGAARATLDLVEEVVNDPAGLAAVMQTVVSNLRPPAAPEASREEPAPVEHIPVR